MTAATTAQIRRLTGVQFTNASLPTLVELPGVTVSTLVSTVLDGPSAIVIDPAGTYAYVAGSINNKIYKITIADGTVAVLAGSGTASSLDGTGTAATFNVPQGLCMDSSGTNIYVCESAGMVIRKIVVSTGVVTTIAGSGASATTDGTGVLAAFRAPYALAINKANDTLYVTEFSGHCVRKVVISTTVVTTIAGTAGTSGHADGVGTAAKFNSPMGCRVDPTNRYLYIAGYTDYTIRRLDLSSLQVVTLAGKPLVSGDRDGYGQGALLNRPTDVQLDSAGKVLYFGEWSSHRIKRLFLDSGRVETVAGTGVVGTTDGEGTAAAFGTPRAIAWHEAGKYLLICDYTGDDIRKMM